MSLDPGGPTWASTSTDLTSHKQAAHYRTIDLGRPGQTSESLFTRNPQEPARPLCEAILQALEKSYFCNQEDKVIKPDKSQALLAPAVIEAFSSRVQFEKEFLWASSELRASLAEAFNDFFVANRESETSLDVISDCEDIALEALIYSFQIYPLPLSLENYMNYVPDFWCSRQGKQAVFRFKSSFSRKIGTDSWSKLKESLALTYPKLKALV